MLITKAHNFFSFVHLPLCFPLYVRQYTFTVYKHLQAQNKGYFGAAGETISISHWMNFSDQKTCTKTNPLSADSALSKENTVCADLIESAANRRHPLWALSA